MNKKTLYPLLVLLGGGAVMGGLVLMEPAPSGETYTPPPTTVRTVLAQKQDEHLIVRSQGTVQPRTESQLIPEVSGRVLWMSPALVAGGRFAEGDTLLRIDTADYKNAVDRSGAALTRASVEQEHAADELKRLEKLHSQNLSSQSQLDDGDRRFRVAEANLIEAHINLEQAQRDLARTEITAPYEGRVRSEQVDLGQFVARGNVIATIYATDYVEVRLPIASSQLSYMAISIAGQLPEQASPVTLSSYLGKVKFIWEGELVRTEAEIDATSRMLYGVARVRNATAADMPPLAVGLFVQAAPNPQLGYGDEDAPARTRYMGALLDDDIVDDIDQVIRWTQGNQFRRTNGRGVGIVGFCVGGRIAYLAATSCADLHAAVCYYPGRILLPFGDGQPQEKNLAGNYTP